MRGNWVKKAEISALFFKKTKRGKNTHFYGVLRRIISPVLYIFFFFENIQSTKNSFLIINFFYRSKFFLMEFDYMMIEKVIKKHITVIIKKYDQDKHAFKLNTFNYYKIKCTLLL